MDDSRRRNLVLIGVLGLLLLAPYVLGSRKQASQAKAANTAQSASAAQPAEAATGQSSEAAGPGIAPSSAAQPAVRQLAHLETAELSVEVSSLSGGLTHALLKADPFRGHGKPVDIVTTDLEEYLPLRVEVDGLPSDPNGSFELHPTTPRSVLLTRVAGGLAITRKLEAGRGPYQLWLTTQIHNQSQSTRKVRLHVPTFHYVTRESEGSKVPLLPVRSWFTSQGLCRHDGELERKDRKSLGSGADYGGPIVYGGIENVYFLSAIAPDAKDADRCRLEAEARGGAVEDPTGTLWSARISYKEVELGPGGNVVYRTLAYLGPKSPAELGAAGHALKSAIQSGWFTSLAEGLTWLLRRIHGGVGNWGVAIILLTFFVKLVLFPLTAKQMQSMAKMKELKPELDRINDLYGDDREKKGAAIMELYRKRGVNPLAGCFPVLLQLPIWFSLYSSLSSNVELFRAPFALWWADLSTPDPFFVLPLALGVLMFVQQKMTPATGMDPVQQKMMLYMMPTMITSFMLFLPAGLCLYMFTNSALSIGQQRLIEARLKQNATPPSPPTK